MLPTLGLDQIVFFTETYTTGECVVSHQTNFVALSYSNLSLITVSNY
jgi:hypothetical protein